MTRAFFEWRAGLPYPVEAGGRKNKGARGCLSEGERVAEEVVVVVAGEAHRS